MLQKPWKRRFDLSKTPTKKRRMGMMMTSEGGFLFVVGRGHQRGCVCVCVCVCGIPRIGRVLFRSFVLFLLLLVVGA